MADDPNPGQEPQQTPPGETPDPNETPGQESDEQFDKDRAMRTIAKLRDEAKAAKALAKEHEQLKAKLTEHETAQLSEKEKAEKRAADAEQKAQAAEARIKAITLKATVERNARKLNIIDEDAAYRLLDLDAIEYDGDEPVNVETLLKALVKDKPYLVAEKNGIPATPKPTDRNVLSEAEQQQQRQRFGTLVSRMYR